MGMIFNGMTIKYLAQKLEIIKPNPKIIEIKNLIKKEIFLKAYKKFKLFK